MSNLHLEDDKLIASGGNRRCFYHPENDNLCVKVLLPEREEKIQIREWRYYKSLQRRDISWEHMAKFEGAVNTNYGLGLVYELVRDFDGQISRTLDHYLKLDDDALNGVILQKIEELKAYLYDQAIVFRDLVTLNILLRRTDENTYVPVVIDGIGHNDFIPLCNYSLGLSRKKIVRIWNRKKDGWFEEYASIRDRVLGY